MRHKLTKHERALVRRVTNVGVVIRSGLHNSIGPFSTKLWFNGYMSAVRAMVDISQDVRLSERHERFERMLVRLSKPGRFVRRTRKTFVLYDPQPSPSHPSISST